MQKAIPDYRHKKMVPLHFGHSGHHCAEPLKPFPARRHGDTKKSIPFILDSPYYSRAVLPKPPHEPVSAKLAYLKLRPLPPLRDFGHLSTSFWTALCRTIKTISRTKTRRHKEIYSIHFGQPLRVVGDWLSRDIVRFPDSVSALTIPFFPFFPLLSFWIPQSRATSILDILDSPVQNHKNYFSHEDTKPQRFFTIYHLPVTSHIFYILDTRSEELEACLA